MNIDPILLILLISSSLLLIGGIYFKYAQKKQKHILDSLNAPIDYDLYMSYGNLVEKPKRRPQVKKTTTRKVASKMPSKPGLYANIHKKQERIEKQKAAGGKVETMRKPGSKGAPTAQAFKNSAKTTKGKK